MESFLKILLIILVQASIIFPKSTGKTALLLPSELKAPDSNSKIYKAMIDDITLFEIFLMQSKLNYDVIYTDELKDFETERFEVIIIPSSFDFDSEDFVLLKKMLSKGTGLLSLGNFNVIEENQKIDLYKKLSDMECFEKDDFSLNTITQSFYSNTNHFIPFDSFELLLSKKDANNFYKTDNIKSFSFGCVNRLNEYTTSFFGFSGSGRYTHFGFAFSKILSDKSEIKKFEKLLLKTIDWLKKDSGIRVSVLDNSKKQLLVMIDLSQGLLYSEKIINKFKEENYSLLLVSEDIGKLKEAFQIYQNNISYGIKINLVCDIDTILQTLRHSSIKPKFLLFDDYCFDERDIKKLSFEGIENILVKKKSEEKVYSLYDILVTSYEDFSLAGCSEGQIFLLDIVSKINCREDFIEKILAEIKKQSEFLIPFEREQLIYHFLISSLKVDYLEIKNLFEIKIQNPTDKEIKNLLLILDKNSLYHKLIYDLKINDKSTFLKKDNPQDILKIKLDNLSPNSTTIIKIFFEDHI